MSLSIQAITNQYNSEKIPEIIKDYQNMQTHFGDKCQKSSDEDKNSIWNSNLDKKILNNDHICAKAMSTIAILNGPTNMSDVFSAYKQIKSKFKDKMPDGYDPKIAQHPASFFRGTILHEYLNPNSEKCIDKKLAKYIVKNDVSLRDTKLGKWVLNKLQIEEIDKIDSSIKSLYHTQEKPNCVKANIYKSKNLFGDLTARALTRTSKYGTYVLGGIGALHIAHQVADGENIFKETAKTALQVGATLVGVGYLGAIGYKHFGTLGSLTGIATGTGIGTFISQQLFPKQENF